MEQILSQFSWWSVIDILIVATVIYHILLLVKGTRTAQMLVGTIVVFTAFWLSSIVPLMTVKWIMGKFYSSLILIIFILFQDDIRLALSRIGKRSFLSQNDNLSSALILDEITRASFELSKRRCGALIVFERNIILSRYVDIGTLLDARVSKELVLALFHTSSPVHDGAVIIQKGRLAAAGCFLPLTRDTTLTKDYGTRHRAGIGISEETDAIVIVVSEETRAISLVNDGHIQVVSDKESLRKALQKYLVDQARFLNPEKVEKVPESSDLKSRLMKKKKT